MRRLMAVAGIVVAVSLGGYLTQAETGSTNSDDKMPKTLTVDLGGGIKMDFVLIQPGSFVMGSNTAHDSMQEPAHKVTITKPFYMGKFEVTQEQWKLIMGDNPSYYVGDKNPVGEVSWNDCQDFVKKLNELKKGVATFRLPTEAEWEYACRAGSTTDFCYGDDESVLGEYAWYSANSDNTIHAVGQKKPNACGLYDMHGNVWEWCQDWYDYYAAGEQIDPTGPVSGKGRVLRGGSRSVEASDCRSARRSYSSYTIDKRYGAEYVGLRLVCVAAETEPAATSR